MHTKPTTKKDFRMRRRVRIRARVSGTAKRPRLAVFRSNRYVSVQLIDDTKEKTLASAHGREFKGSQATQAAKVGAAIAKKATDAGITEAVFDRGGYRYGGQVRALAEAARAGGLIF